MQVTITAVGPDHAGLADPIVHYVTGEGANIAEIQMYDHDQHRLFAMLLRIQIAEDQLDGLRHAMDEIGQLKGLSIRVWARSERAQRPRIAICTTYRPEPALALLRAIRDGRVPAEPAVIIGNRKQCRSLAEQFNVPWHMIGNDRGDPDNGELIRICDEQQIDYLIMARYMRVLPPDVCWKYAGGRIINLHHGLLPCFPGLRPYHDAHAGRMLTYGATCHYVVPELDAGAQTIYQSTFAVPPGMAIEEIIRRGQEDNEPHCLVEGIRRVIEGEVQLHYQRVVAR